MYIFKVIKSMESNMCTRQQLGFSAADAATGQLVVFITVTANCHLKKQIQKHGFLSFCSKGNVKPFAFVRRCFLAIAYGNVAEW